MPGALDKAARAAAKIAVGIAGRTAILRTKPAAEAHYTGTAPTGTPTDYPCEVVISEWDESQVDGTLVKAGDRKALVSALRIGVEPTQDRDVLVMNGVDWRVVGVRAIASGEQEAAFWLHIRR